jgi:hypothetical protein
MGAQCVPGTSAADEPDDFPSFWTQESAPRISMAGAAMVSRVRVPLPAAAARSDYFSPCLESYLLQPMDEKETYREHNSTGIRGDADAD